MGNPLRYRTALMSVLINNWSGYWEALMHKTASNKVTRKLYCVLAYIFVQSLLLYNLLLIESLPCNSIPLTVASPCYAVTAPGIVVAVTHQR